MNAASSTQRPRIIIIGAGFGGIHAARELEGKPVDVLLIDRNNYHTFTPLLYQVATCGLEPGEIAYPVRGIFRSRSNVTFVLGEVIALDREARSVSVRVNGSIREERYDYLIVAAGSVTHYFGKPEFAQHAFELKTLEDSVRLRNHILRSFEIAATTTDEAYRKALTTIVVVGGGATGLETAGALHELLDKVLRKEHAFLDSSTATVYLVEASDRLLRPYPEILRIAAHDQLTSLGVKVVLGKAVETVDRDGITLADGERIETRTLIWSAGVKGSPLTSLFGLKTNGQGRVPVNPTLEVADEEGLYVVGDLAYLASPTGEAYAMLIPVAKQQGISAAHNILRQIQGEAPVAFRYNDRGVMATIGRSRAVAHIFNRIPLRGYLAWIAWLSLHLVALMGFRNRLNVLINWIWNYFTYDRSVRIILDRPQQGNGTAQVALTPKADVEPAPAAHAALHSTLIEG